MLHQPGLDRVHKFMAGTGISPSSRAPSGIATMSGCSSDSNQTGEPHFAQKHLSPLPELYFVTGAPGVSILSEALSAMAQVAGAVPANFVQLVQKQKRADRNLPRRVNCVEPHRQDP